VADIEEQTGLKKMPVEEKIELVAKLKKEYE